MPDSALSGREPSAERSRRSYLQSMVAEASRRTAARVAVAYPCTIESLRGAIGARELAFADPVLVGPAARIRALAEQEGLDIAEADLVDTGDDPLAAAQACVELCRAGKAELIMKGSLHTDELMGAAIRDGGMRTARRISHAFAFSLPSYAKPLFMADCVVNINPGLMEKRDIVQNTVDLVSVLGIERPFVAVLSAIETINPAIAGTVEAAALSKMAERGQITGAFVDGPLAFDIAISSEAARVKGLGSPFHGRPDILIVPNLEAGNMLYKQLVYLAEADCAGIVLGTKVPIVLTSRSDTAACRIASCALAVLYLRERRSAS